MSLQVKSSGGVAPPYRLSQVACCAYPSCLCTPIVSHFWRFVKGFFYFFLGAVGDLNPHFNILPTLGGYSNLLARVLCWRCDLNAHHPFADSTEDTSHRWENPTRTGGVAHRGTLRNRRTPSAFCTLIVSHSKGFVKRFFREVGSFLFSTFADSALSYRSNLSVLLEEMASRHTPSRQ